MTMTSLIPNTLNQPKSVLVAINARWLDVDPNEDSQLPTATNKPRRMPPRLIARSLDNDKMTHASGPNQL